MTISERQKDLQNLERLGLYRSLKSVDSPQGREIILDGRPVLNFSSNDYLGLSNDPRLKQAACRAVEASGVGAGASRLICGNMGTHERLEEELALFKNTPSALLFSCGYMANIGILQALMDRRSVVLSDRLNHASIIDGIILSRAKFLRYPHADIQALEETLKNLPAGTVKLIVTDTVFSMDGDRAPLKDIVELSGRYGAGLMVDEAHAFGVLGPHGGGLVEELGLGDRVDVQMGTLSKAAGCYGAYVCGKKTLREYLVNKCRSFIYTTALPPALAESARVALRIIRDDVPLRRKLQASSDDLRVKLKALGFDGMNSTTPIIPILVKESSRAQAMSRKLLEQGIYVPAIRPPTVPEGTARLRITVTAAHTQEDFDRLLQTLKTM
jgi:8-amino-7-oxononanoate synthase